MTTHKSTKRTALSIIITTMLLNLGSLLSAQIPSAHDPGLKAGIELGYPSAVNFGWRLDKDFELNVMAGSRYEHFDIGANGLFRLTSLEIDKEPFPFSIGPELILGLGDSYVGFDVLGIARIENTLRTVPFNVFLQAGLGLHVLPETTFTGTGCVGLRFVFDHPAIKTFK